MPSLEDDIRYIGTKIRDWHAQTDVPHLGVPADMRVDPSSEEEWQCWRPIDSSITLEMIADFERQLPAPLPQFFRAYILGCHTLGMDFGEYHLPESPSDKTLAQSFSTLPDSTFWAAGYMQFGSARGCGDPLLFDFQSTTSDGDYAIVVFNHDVVPHEVLNDRKGLKPYESLLAHS
ncbi:MAG: SMI1/KNR4 family protein, partial [Planctomycetota bacterium]